MGYDYTIRGWYKSDRPVELNAVRPTDDRYDWTGWDAPDRYPCVTGRERNYVAFATQAKRRSNYCLAALSEIIASCNSSRFGLVTITGEIYYDGTDRFVVVRDGMLLTLPTARLYDPLSPWNAIYHRSHYMGRPVEELVPAESGSLRARFGGTMSVKGWLYLHDHRTSEQDAERITAGVVSRCPELAGGIAFANQFSEPYLLFGQQDVAAAVAIQSLADITAAHERSYGILYCSTPDERSQIPVAFENGRIVVLPEISLTAETEAELLPTDLDEYEGLGDGSETVAIHSSLDLDGLARQLMQLLHAEPIEPYGGWREQLNGDLRGYKFNAPGLTCVLMNNYGEGHSAWPYALTHYLQGPADPSRLKQQVEELTGYLRSGGVEIRVDGRG